MKNNTIYVRVLKHADHTVFCVEDGQKAYWDPQFKTQVPFSSGQQVKHSMMLELCNVLNEQPSPTTFIFDVKNKEIKEAEVYGTCNPSFTDQLIGGWMKACKGGDSKTLKRRSPLSISAMRSLHPQLANLSTENASFDRSDRSNNVIIVRDEKGEKLTDEQIVDLLAGKDRSLSRKWIQGGKRASGLFVHDIAIDLDRLFSVNLNPFEPEISKEVEELLRSSGWKEITTYYGKSLLAPKETRDNIIPALAHAILNWRITSNQSRTFSLMETLAVAISHNATDIAGAIRARLVEAGDRVEPVVEENIPGINTYVTLPADGYLNCINQRVDALSEAKKQLIELMSNYNYGA